MSQSPSPPLSGGRGFYKEGEGNRRERSRKGFEKFSTHRTAPSILIRPVCVILALEVSRSPGAEMPEGWSLSFLKLVPIVTQHGAGLPTARCSGWVLDFL